MKKNILMIYPEFPETYWSFKHTLFYVGKKSSFPPLGLITVAALLPQDYEITLVDLNIETLDQSLIADADLIFISAMIVQKKSFDEIVTLCGSFGKPVIAGGPYPSSSYSEIDGVSGFILNEAENTIQQFVTDFENGKLKKIYSSDTKPDIKNIPAPRYDLIKVSMYSNMLLQYSRGCPFNCEFCDIIEMFGRQVRTKSPEQFLRELDILYAMNFRGGVFIVDDNFVGNIKEVKTLLRQIIIWQKEKKYPFTFFTEASINCAGDDELLNLMSKSGFDMLFIGIETPDEKALASINKKQNLHIDLMSSIKKIQQHGMEVTGGFIVGFDTDTESIFDTQIDFIQRAGIPVAMVGLLTALPGTQLYRRLQSENRLLFNSSGNNTHDMRLNFIPVLETKKLSAGYRRIVSAIYSPVNYFQRSLVLLRNLPAKKASYRKIDRSQIRALLLSLWCQTFSSYGIHYLMFLFRAVLINPRLFSEAIGITVKGDHLFKITRELQKADDFVLLLDRSADTLWSRLSKLTDSTSTNINAQVEYQIDRVMRKVMRKYKRLTSETRYNMLNYLNHFESNCLSLIETFQSGKDNLSAEDEVSMPG